MYKFWWNNYSLKYSFVVVQYLNMWLFIEFVLSLLPENLLIFEFSAQKKLIWIFKVISAVSLNRSCKFACHEILLPFILQNCTYCRRITLTSTSGLAPHNGTYLGNCYSESSFTVHPDWKNTSCGHKIQVLDIKLLNGGY